jgi:hypothetical protein
MESMEKFARVIAFSTAAEGNETRCFSSANVVLTISTVTESTVRDLTFPVAVPTTNGTDTATKSEIHLSSEALSELLDQNGTSRLAVFSMVYNNLENFMPPSTTESSNTSSQSVGDLRKNSNELPHTSIVSLSIVDTAAPYSSSSTTVNLKEPVLINYTNVKYVKNGKHTCSFWQFGRNSEAGFWSSSDVTTNVLGDTNVLCSSTHLTSFCVLVAIQDPAVSDSLSYITYIGCGISLASLSLALLCFIYFRSHLHFQKNFVHINFVIALMLALVFFLGGINQSHNDKVCQAMTVIMHYFFLAIFCWMLCEGILLYMMVVVVFDSGKTYSALFFALGWGLPLVIVGVSFGARYDYYGNSDYCFLTQHNGLIYAFVGPMIAILLVNLGIFIVVLKIVVSRVSDIAGRRVAYVKSGLRAAAVLMPIMGLTWAVGVFAVDSLSLPLAYMFTILNSLQGLFVLIFHCLLDKGVQNSFSRLRRRWSVDSSMVSAQCTLYWQLTSYLWFSCIIQYIL